MFDLNLKSFIDFKSIYHQKFIKFIEPFRPQVASSLFFRHNTALGPPYQILVDTNFINFSIQNKLELVQAMMDCLYAKCTLYFYFYFYFILFFLKVIASRISYVSIIGIPCITDCVMAELEKLGPKYRIALR